MKIRHLWLFLPVLCVIFFLVNQMDAGAVSSSEIQNQIQQLQQQEQQLQSELSELERRLNENADSITEIVERKQTIDKQISLLMETVQNTDDQIAAYARLIADNQERLDTAQQQLDKLHHQYKSRIRAMEEEGELSYWAVLFRSGSFSDFLDRLNMIQEIARADRQRLEEIRAASGKVEVINNDLQLKKAELSAIREEQDATQSFLSRKQEETAELLAKLIEQGDVFASLLEQSEEAQHALMEQIAKLEDEYDEAVYQEWLATYVPPTTAAPEIPEHQQPSNDSGWLTPVPYYTLTSPFGMRFHPILGVYRMHNGVDLACAAMTPIYASRGGKVTIARESDSAGFYVQIYHGDGYSSVYMHMTCYVVKEGEFVAQGQLIGYVGNTGLSKGDHLHFGISYLGEYVNPMEYIG